MVWLIVLAVLCGLAFFPLGFSAVYRENDPGVWLLVGPVRFRIYPGKEKSNKKDTKSHKSFSPKGGSYRDFEPVVRAILDFLGQFRKKIRVQDLQLYVTLAGDDPCDLAVNYGRAWAALGAFVPQLDRLFVIKKRDLAVNCDFAGDKTRVYAKIKATITLAGTLQLLSRHGVKVIKELLELKKLQKGGARV